MPVWNSVLDGNGPILWPLYNNGIPAFFSTCREISAAASVSLSVTERSNSSQLGNKPESTAMSGEAEIPPVNSWRRQLLHVQHGRPLEYLLPHRWSLKAFNNPNIEYAPENLSRFRILPSWSNSRSCPSRNSVSKLRVPGASIATPSSESTVVGQKGTKVVLCFFLKKASLTKVQGHFSFRETHSRFWNTHMKS